MRKILVRLGLLLPLTVYALTAIHAALFVPCIRTAPSSHAAFTDPAYMRRIGETIYLPNITTETVRYDLVFFKEFLLLVLLLSAYAIILACSETTRCRLRGWIDDWR